MLLYLHGFTSGPPSYKAQALRARMAQRGLDKSFCCPQLPASPKAAIAVAEKLIRDNTISGIVGSSLGGFYATYLAERHGLRAVLVNPAVVAHLALADYVGQHRWLYSCETFEFTLQHVDELRELECGSLTRPERYWLLAETGDETLDYRHAVTRYANARQTILPGGDHSFTHWDDYLDEIIDFVAPV